MRAATDSGSVAALTNAKPHLHRYFIRRLHSSSQDADDLTQEVCERFLAYGSRDEITDTRRYLFGIARNVLADYFRERQTRRRIDDRAADVVEGSTGYLSNTLRDPVQLQTASDLVTRLLYELPKAYRAVLLAHEGEGYSYRETAARLGFTEGTVETYLKLAKGQLRQSRIAAQAK